MFENIIILTFVAFAVWYSVRSFVKQFSSEESCGSCSCSTDSVQHKTPQIKYKRRTE